VRAARKRRITIDVEQHRSDRQVRSTLLHEMCHAAKREDGHGPAFFAQLERLLRAGAPITVNNPEAGKVRIFYDLIPPRFPLLKRLFDKLEARRARKIEREVKAKMIPTYEISDDQIVSEFADYEAAALRWKQALVAVGLHYGLTDETGRPKNRWAARLVKRAKRAHTSARRNHLADQKRYEQVMGARTAVP